MQKYTIKTTYRNDKDKQGVPLVSKQGKPYTRLSLKVNEIGNGETWLSGFGNKTNEQWKEGDVVELIVTQNGQYYNFETPKLEDLLAARVSALEVQMMNLTNSVSRLQGGKVSPASVAEPTDADIAAEFNRPPSETQPPF